MSWLNSRRTTTVSYLRPLARIPPFPGRVSTSNKRTKRYNNASTCWSKKKSTEYLVHAKPVVDDNYIPRVYTYTLTLTLLKTKKASPPPPAFAPHPDFRTKNTYAFVSGNHNNQTQHVTRGELMHRGKKAGGVHRHSGLRLQGQGWDYRGSTGNCIYIVIMIWCVNTGGYMEFGGPSRVLITMPPRKNMCGKPAPP